jgi:hypothetical protein
MSKKSKKVSTKGKVISKLTSFLRIERIWAENGMVKVQEKNGRITHLLPQDAAARAQIINNMPISPWHQGRRNTLIEQIIAACRQARYQLEEAESRGDKKAQSVKNILEGKTAEGKLLSEIQTEEDRLVNALLLRYPRLIDHEVRVVLNYHHLRQDQKMHILESVNESRKAEAAAAVL